MPLLDLNSPTGLFLQWGWLLVARANALVYILIVVVFVLGATLRLPRAKRDIAVAEAAAVARRDDGATAGGVS